MTKFPIDLTPLERAQLKMVSHIAIIFIFNLGLAAMLYFQNTAGPYNWPLLLTSVFAQAVLAVLDALKKLYSAQFDVPYSTIIDMARKEAATRAPAMQPDQAAMVAIVQDALNNLLLKQNNAAPPVIGQSADLQPRELGQIPVNTLPGIQAINVPK